MPRRFAPRNDGGKADDGFTLVEVLVAFTIIALTLTMAMQVLANGAGWARRGPASAARIEEAVSLVDAMLADPLLGPGERAGTFADGSRWVVRTLDLTALVAPHAPGRLLRLEIFAGPPVGRPLFVTAAVSQIRR